MKELKIIFSLRKRLFLNTLAYSIKENLLKWIILGILTLLFIAGDFIFFYRIIAYMKDIPFNAGEILIPHLLNIIFLTFFSMLLFSNVITSISTCFLSSDLTLLHSYPISAKTIFVSKFIQTIISASWMLFLFGLPIVFAYGFVYEASLSFYFFVIPILIPFLIIPGGIGVIITTAILKFLPAKKIYQIFSFLGLFFGVILIIYLRFLKPEILLGKNVPDHLIVQFVETLKIPDYPFLPNNWITNGIILTAVSDYSNLAYYLALLWAGAMVSFFTALFISVKIYYKAWESTSFSRISQGTPQKRLFYIMVNYLLKGISREQRSLFMKDIKVLLRDPAQWSQFFLLGALIVVYVFNVRNLPLNTLYLKSIVSVVNIGLAGIVLSAVAARLVFPSISVEGKSFWIMRSSPVKVSYFLWEKFFLNLIPLLILSEGLIVLSNLFLGVDSYIMYVSVIAIFLITLGVTGLSIGIGARYPVFKFENIAEIAMSTGGILFMVLSFFYIAITVMLVSRPIHIHLSSLIFSRNISGYWDIYMCYAMILIISTLATIMPVIAGIKSLSRLDV